MNFALRDRDGMGCMKEVGLLDTGGPRSLVMAVDETPRRCAGMDNTLGVTGGEECVTVINGRLIVLPDKGGTHSMLTNLMMPRCLKITLSFL